LLELQRSNVAKIKPVEKLPHRLPQRAITNGKFKNATGNKGDSAPDPP